MKQLTYRSYPRCTKRPRHHHRAAIGLILVLAVGCGTWVGRPKNPQPGTGGTTSDVALIVQGSPTTLSLLGAPPAIPVTNKAGQAGGTITLTTAVIALAGIQLKTASDDSEGQGQFAGPYVVDLLTNQMTPTPAPINVPAGSYQDIQMKLDQLVNPGTTGISPSNPVLGHTVYLAGTYVSPAGQSKAFSMSFDVEETYSLAQSHKSKGTTLVGGSNSLIIAFRMPQWFVFNNSQSNPRLIDFSDLTTANVDLTTDDRGIGEALREAIKQNIKGSANFGRDQHGDGQLSSDEDNEAD